MEFIPFANCFPEIAEKETNLFEIPHATNGLPAGEYMLQEWYCLDKTCDCRKVIINISPIGKPTKILASIGYGWESRDHYKQWAYGDDKLADMMLGTYVELAGQQSSTIKNHYNHFKAMVKRIGRNDPCPCGCGRKYKKHTE